MAINLENFRKSLIYEVNQPVEEIRSDINQIVALDRDAEIKQAKFNQVFTIGIIGLILAFIGFIVALIFTPSTPNGSQPLALSILIVVLILAFIGFLITAIYGGIKKSYYAKFNFINYRYELISKLLEMFTRDMEENANINLRLILSAANHKSKLIQTLPHPYKRKFKIDIFQDEWLNISGIFLDQTRFSLSVTELTQTQYGWKTSRSGKSKYKSKSKSKGLRVSLSLFYRSKQYGAIQILKEQANAAIKLPTDVSLQKIEIDEKQISLLVKLHPSREWKRDNLYQAIAMMFMSIYQILNLAKMLSKKKEA